MPLSMYAQKWDKKYNIQPGKPLKGRAPGKLTGCENYFVCLVSPFSYKEVQIKINRQSCTFVKINCPPTENVTETPAQSTKESY